MGSKTALLLSMIEALSLLAGCDLSPSKLVELSGRGGTSGVGVSSYFSGGMIFDLGRPNDNLPFVPSSADATGLRPRSQHRYVRCADPAADW
jgi:beta-ribofuranosylaminobenzene 5'-phosphate synthase